MTRLAQYYEDIAKRVWDRMDNNCRNVASDHALDACTRWRITGRIQAYAVVIDDLARLLPAWELPWKAAAKRYRARVKQLESVLALRERELGNAYDKIEKLVLK